jgi:DnaK suppressor protein
MAFDPAAGEAALDQAAAELDAVDAALGRLEDGSFEKCSVCGAPIDRDRLLQDPLLARCQAHAEAP